VSVRQTNQFWAVSLDLTLFLDFLKLVVKMCLAVSFAGVQKSNFSNLQIKSYGCLKFFGRVYTGWACARANEEELTTCAKKLGQEVGGGGQEGGNNGGHAQARSATNGCKPPTVPRPTVSDH
jgi:hypothetical protein